MATDSFTGTGALSASWVSIPTIGANFDRDTDQLAAIADGGSAYYWNDNFSGNQYAQLKLITLPASGYTAAGPMIKVSEATEYGYYVRVFPDAVDLVRVGSGGTTSPAAGQVTRTNAINDVIKITAETNGADLDIKLWVNGSQIGTTYTDTSPLTGTRIGIYSYYNDQTWRADDFEGGLIANAVPVLSAPGVQSITETTVVPKATLTF